MKDINDLVQKKLTEIEAFQNAPEGEAKRQAAFKILEVDLLEHHDKINTEHMDSIAKKLPKLGFPFHPDKQQAYIHYFSLDENKAAVFQENCTEVFKQIYLAFDYIKEYAYKKNFEAEDIHFNLRSRENIANDFKEKNLSKKVIERIQEGNRNRVYSALSELGVEISRGLVHTCSTPEEFLKAQARITEDLCEALKLMIEAVQFSMFNNIETVSIPKAVITHKNIQKALYLLSSGECLQEINVICYHTSVYRTAFKSMLPAFFSQQIVSQALIIPLQTHEVAVQSGKAAQPGLFAHKKTVFTQAAQATVSDAPAMLRNEITLPLFKLHYENMVQFCSEREFALSVGRDSVLRLGFS